MANVRTDITGEEEYDREIAEFVKSNFALKGEAKEIVKLVDEIYDYANSDKFASFSQEDFKKETANLRERVRRGAKFSDVEKEAFALVINAAKRVRGINVKKIQVLGALSMLRGHIIEMATGEGKTITSLLPIYVQSLFGQVHVASSREALSMRDCLGYGEDGKPSYGDVLRYLGVTVGITLSDEGLKAAYNMPVIVKPDVLIRKNQAYECDVVYGTVSEFAFDYLRNNIATSVEDQIHIPQRSTIIVDEADQLLIDIQQNPLIISSSKNSHDDDILNVRSSEFLRYMLKRLDSVREELTQKGASQKQIEAELNTYCTIDPETFAFTLGTNPGAKKFAVAVFGSEEAYNDCLPLINEAVKEQMVPRKIRQAQAFVEGLKKHTDNLRNIYIQQGFSDAQIDEFLRPVVDIDPEKGITLGTQGVIEAANFYGDNESVIRDYDFIHNALVANYLLEEGKQYIVENGQVVLIDSTGTKQPTHKYTSGLHQAIEIKHDLEPTKQYDSVAKTTVPAFMSMYRGVAGMTGTASAAGREFANVYGLDVSRIPRSNVNRRKDVLRTFKTMNEKEEAILRYVQSCQETGQPILLGTTSVEESREYDRILTENGIAHEVLNAEEENARRESQIIAKAGRRGAVTIATAMAGRGTDISLGGGDPEEKKALEKLGGLMVILTQLSTSQRTAEQLRGRAGRFGDVGTTITCASLEDEVVITYCKQNSIDLNNVGPKKMQRIIDKAQRAAEIFDKRGRENAIKVDKAFVDQMNIIYGIRQEILDGSYFKKQNPNGTLTADYDVIDEWMVNYLNTAVDKAINSHLVKRKVNMSNLETELKLARAIPLDSDLAKYTDENGNCTLSAVELKKVLLSMGCEDYDSRKKDFLANGTFEDRLREIMLSSIDSSWSDHIYNMEEIKKQLFTRTFGTQNFEEDYRKICYNQFNEGVVDRIMRETCYAIQGLTPPAHENEKVITTEDEETK